jgi:hypothetical protein
MNEHMPGFQSLHYYEHFMFQDTARYYTVSFLMNHLHAYSHFRQTLLPPTRTRFGA